MMSLRFEFIETFFRECGKLDFRCSENQHCRDVYVNTDREMEETTTLKFWWRDVLL